MLYLVAVDYCCGFTCSVHTQRAKSIITTHFSALAIVKYTNIK